MSEPGRAWRFYLDDMAGFAEKVLAYTQGLEQAGFEAGTEQPEYVPDFVAETDSSILMVEAKARIGIASQEVQTKAAAAARWCRHACDHAAEIGAKPWNYLLVPHDEINESRRLPDFLRFEVKQR